MKRAKTKRCALRAAHEGAHLWVASVEAPLLGECLARPAGDPRDSEWLTQAQREVVEMVDTMARNYPQVAAALRRRGAR